ncbi:putative sulfite reductase-associated electron transfer protein DsrO [Desulfobulbus propionicus DSM 2032]|jgi:molybdopterin-containing oxidoreductase family iron-sulfur binding subunit|uniref:Sulfite reductase-associated electron transfer protein DsrO n=1 Tax=Desulfobulbus propionicus (strain ATCC 33891 / DSM 2032 / VKM B-1956 / 1pr3) TaxID=577650 RepID=A0A7U3YJI1_DESPD|nr:4Fe-4S dicluster domain-containing protein [Desulfobulbus propionicus]ADW16480.1 putative sulfite reductase-associated electron transfer protein DsrO [Desulfobulbus propionicus DSM 2032]
MDTNRRNFLKVAGISTLAGLGGTAVVDRLVSGAGLAHATSAGHGAEQAGAAAGHGGAAQGGIRYGMVIDIKKFQEDPGLGAKAVHACHKIHNVPQFPDKRDEIKWIWMTNFENAFPEKPNLYLDEASEKHQLPILCNHCDNPPCVRACPTKATFRSEDGIIGMDYHRCIGCRFCMAACPYGSRSFNWRDPRSFITDINRDYPARTRGVVEKCNFCVERVQIGKLPACVEAVGDSKALVFGNLNDPNSEIRKILKEQHTIQRNPSLGTLPSVFYIV